MVYDCFGTFGTDNNNLCNRFSQLSVSFFKILSISSDLNPISSRSLSWGDEESVGRIRIDRGVIARSVCGSLMLQRDLLGHK